MEPEERNQLLADMIDMYAFLEELVAAKRGRDDDDVLADLIRAEEDGETLTHEELIAQVITLYVADHEPTAGLVGNGLRALLDFPDQWKLLQYDRSLLRGAVTELLRYDERGVVWQHDAAGPDPDAGGAARHVRDHDRRRRARDPGHVVVLREPEPLVAEPLRVPREIERVPQRRRGIAAADDGGEVQDRETGHGSSLRCRCRWCLIRSLLAERDRRIDS